MNKLHITHKQWLCFLKWVTYSAMFVLALSLQSTVLSRITLFGAKLNLIPACLICVAIVEGAERGGVFALCTSLVWAMTGSDFGFVSIVVLTAAAMCSAWLCSSFLYSNLLPCALCCFVALLANDTMIFLLRLYLGSVTPIEYLVILLPGIVLSMLGCPVFYYLSRAITKIED